MKAIVVVVAGAALGVIAALGDVFTGPRTPDFVRVFFQIPNLGLVWAAAAFLTGLWFRRLPWSAVFGCFVLLFAVAGYYGFGITLGDRQHVGLEGVASVMLKWTVAAILGGSVLGGLAFYYVRGGRWSSFLGALALPFVIVAHSGYLLFQSLPYLGNDPWREGVLALIFVGGLSLAISLFLGRRKRLGSQTAGATTMIDGGQA